jgi:hypothetical protein
MIEHLVLLKLKPDASAAEEEQMVKALKSLSKFIPVIRELSCGRNTGDRNQGFTHGLRVRFESAADLEAYIDHPEHKRVVDECLTPVIDDVIVVDYEA